MTPGNNRQSPPDRVRSRPPDPEPLAPLIDAHTHLDACGAVTAADVRAMVDHAESVGVGRVVTVADDLDSARWAVSAADADPRVYAAVALHPTRAGNLTDEARAELETLAAHPRVVAIGRPVWTCIGRVVWRVRGAVDSARGICLAYRAG